MLFTPGHRLDMVEKATRSGADAVIVDLEDSVSLDNKAEARAGLGELPESSVPYYARSARTLGYIGKVAIHPAQIPVINDVFTPSRDVVEYQRKVLAAFEQAEADGKASIAVDGRMADYAVARVARNIIARAEAAASAGEEIRE